MKKVHIPPTVPPSGSLLWKIYVDVMHMPASKGFKYILHAWCSLSTSQKVRIHDDAIYGLMDHMSLERADGNLYSVIRRTPNLAAIVSMYELYIWYIFFPHTCKSISHNYIVAIFLAGHLYGI